MRPAEGFYTRRVRSWLLGPRTIGVRAILRLRAAYGCRPGCRFRLLGPTGTWPQTFDRLLTSRRRADIAAGQMRALFGDRSGGIGNAGTDYRAKFIVERRLCLAVAVPQNVFRIDQHGSGCNFAFLVFGESSPRLLSCSLARFACSSRSRCRRRFASLRSRLTARMFAGTSSSASSSMASSESSEPSGEFPTGPGAGTWMTPSGVRCRFSHVMPSNWGQVRSRTFCSAMRLSL